MRSCGSLRAGRGVLAELCGMEPEVLARALPAFTMDDPKISTGREAEVAQARWRVAGTVAGPASYGCRLCTARRTGQALRAVRYVPRWQRVCLRHGRWLLDADADQPLSTWSCGGCRRWWRSSGGGRAWHGVRCGPGWSRSRRSRWRMRWWPAGGSRPCPGSRRRSGRAVCTLAWWRIVGRDAAIFPEVVAVAQALLEPAMAEVAWQASGGMKPRARSADDPFCHRLGERVGRTWLGPELAADHGSPLNDWKGAIVRARRRETGPPGWPEDPWHLKREQQPATMAGQLRVLAAEQQAGGSGTRWRATVSAEQRLRITQLVDEAREQLVELRGVHSGTTAEVARTLLEHLSQSAELIDRAVLHTAAAAVASGVALEEVAQWSRLPAEELAAVFALGEGED